MHEPHNPRSITRRTRATWLTAVATVTTLIAVISTPLPSDAAEAPVGLGTAADYSVLGGATVTNTGPSTLNRNVGVSPGTAITGFPPGITAGETHAADAQAAQAQAHLGVAYDDAAGRAPTATVAGDLVGVTLPAGVYKSTSTLFVSGVLTLNGAGDPDAVFIFQVASSLGTASASNIALINGAQACNVFWQVGTSATLGTGSTFRGTIMALASISVTTNTTVIGRALARIGQVSLDTNSFTTSSCAATTTTAGPTTTAAGPTTTAAGPTTTAAGPTTTAAGPTTTAAGPTTTAAGPTTTAAGPTTTAAGPTTTAAPATTLAPTVLQPDATTTTAGLAPTTTVAPVAGAGATTSTTGAPLANVRTTPGAPTTPAAATPAAPATPAPGSPSGPSTEIGAPTMQELPRTGAGHWLASVSVLGMLLLILGRQLMAQGSERRRRRLAGQ